MTDSILTQNTSELVIVSQGDELVVDSRLIALRLGVDHKPMLRTVEKYLTELQGFGKVSFENAAITGSVSGKTYQQRFCWLNEDQATFVMSLSRNTPQVVECKVQLVAAFSKAKKFITTVVPAQNDRIRELELENENLRLKSQAADRQDFRIAAYGLPTLLILEGKSDAVVEIEKPTIEVIDNRSNSSYKGQTLVQVNEHLKKTTGKGYKNGAAIKARLEQLGEGGLIAQTPRTVIGDYIPSENLAAVYKALATGDQQTIL